MSHVSYVKQTVSLLPRHQPSSWALSSETRRVQLWDMTWLHVKYDSWRCGRQGSCICGSQWVSFRTVASSSAKFVGAVIWNTTHSVVWHDFFTFEMWILQVCEIWLTHMCFSIGILPYWSLVISQVRGRCHVRHDADSCGIWTNSIIKPDFCHVWDDHQLSSWVLSVKHDILNCETWLVTYETWLLQIWDMTQSISVLDADTLLLLPRHSESSRVLQCEIYESRTLYIRHELYIYESRLMSHNCSSRKESCLTTECVELYI